MSGYDVGGFSTEVTCICAISDLLRDKYNNKSKRLNSLFYNIFYDLKINVCVDLGFDLKNLPSKEVIDMSRDKLKKDFYNGIANFIKSQFKDGIYERYLTELKSSCNTQSAKFDDDDLLQTEINLFSRTIDNMIFSSDEEKAKPQEILLFLQDLQRIVRSDSLERGSASIGNEKVIENNEEEIIPPVTTSKRRLFNEDLPTEEGEIISPLTISKHKLFNYDSPTMVFSCTDGRKSKINEPASPEDSRKRTVNTQNECIRSQKKYKGME